MCNLYRMTRNPDEVARWFAAANEAGGANLAGDVFPGYPGLVVADGALRPMAWGFPLARTGAKGQALKPKPVNNARADRLETAFWRDSFARRRCLIPLTAWAEAEGPRGGKTRSWLSPAEGGAIAAAGLWRRSDEWGDCYTMVMTDAVGEAAGLHPRMPVLLERAEHALWCDGEPAAARALTVRHARPLRVEATDEPWAGR